MVTVALVADQVSKALIRTVLTPHETVAVIPGTFYITYVRNTGAAFGLLPGYRPVFVTTSLAVVAGIAVFWLWTRPRARWLVCALAFVTAGAVGNLIDRLLSGRVTDFLDIAMWPVFNLADSAIVVGVTMVVLWVLFGPEPTRSTRGGGAPDGSGESL